MRTEGELPRLTVCRAWCHLCDDMTAGLQPLQARFRFRLDIVDADAEIENRYGEDVPVLLHGSRELCRHRLDTALVTDYLAGIG